MQQLKKLLPTMQQLKNVA